MKTISLHLSASNFMPSLIGWVHRGMMRQAEVSAGSMQGYRGYPRKGVFEGKYGGQNTQLNLSMVWRRLHYESGALFSEKLLDGQL